MIPNPTFLEHLDALGLAQPLAWSLAAGVAGTLGAMRMNRPVLDAPPRPGHGTDPDAGLLLLGHAAAAREVRVSPRRLLDGLAVVGPDAGRRDVMRGLVVQAAARGLGFAVVSGTRDDGLAEAARSKGACVPSRLSVIDAEARLHAESHTLSPFEGLSAAAIVRMVSAACPGLEGHDPDAVRARALLEAVVGALAALAREGFVDIRPSCLLDHLDLRRLRDLSDREFYPQMPEARRLALSAYLARLPGYVPEKMHKQAASVVERHGEIAARIEDGLLEVCSERFQHCFGRIPETVPADLCAPGRGSVVRAGHGPGDGRVLAFLVACLSEAMLARPGPASTGAPFLVFVDGLDSLPPDVAAAVQRLRRPGVCLVAGLRGVPEADAPARRVAGESGMRLDLGPDGPAVLAVARRRIRLRTLAWTATPGEPLERRVPVSAASVDDMAEQMRLPEVLARFLDPDLPGEMEARDRDSRATVSGRVLASDPIAMAAHFLAGKEGAKQGSAAAIGALLFSDWEPLPPEVPGAVAYAPQRPLPQRPPPPVEPDPAEPFAELDFGSFDPLADLDDIPSPAPLASVRPAPETADAPTAVVIPAGVASDPFLKEKSMRGLAGAPLPLVGPPDTDEAREILCGEFPHLAEVVTRILASVEGRPAVRLRPHLFHGKPGCGKSRFARRLAEVLGVGCVSFNCGGANDSGFGGTSRQWSSGRPSVPLQTVQRLRIANPGILLDEVEKVSDGRLNGSLIDALLTFTERETARRTFDLYLEAEVDLSHVVWLATANTLRGLDAAFVSRFTLVEIPLPRIEHAEVLIPQMVRAVNEERGDAGPWAFDPSEAETEMMAEVWGGGSLRRLRAVVEKTVERLSAIDPARLN